MAKNNLVHSTGGIELVRRLSAAGQRIFTAEQAAKIAPSVGISPGYLREALHHLARSGWIIRLHRGLYALSGSAPGVLSLHDFEVAMALQGIPAARIERLRAASIKGLRVLDPTGPRCGPCNANWNIQVNLPGWVRAPHHDAICQPSQHQRGPIPTGGSQGWPLCRSNSDASWEPAL
jgi:predicted transcriptional regulator of viral defense system